MFDKKAQAEAVILDLESIGNFTDTSARSPGWRPAWSVSACQAMGRVDREQVPELLDLHREIIAAS